MHGCLGACYCICTIVNVEQRQHAFPASIDSGVRKPVTTSYEKELFVVARHEPRSSFGRNNIATQAAVMMLDYAT